MGRPISQAISELKGFTERADYMISIAEDKLQNIYLPEKENFKNYIKRIPMGVSFVIAPWNYPYLTSVNSIIPSLASGNTVILKHSAQTPLCAEQLYESAKKTLPKNVFSFLHLSHEDSLKIVSDNINSPENHVFGLYAFPRPVIRLAVYRPRDIWQFVCVLDCKKFCNTILTTSHTDCRVQNLSLIHI